MGIKPLLPTLAFSILLSAHSFAQTDIPIGAWKSHLPFNVGTYITQSDDRIYYSSRYAVLIIDKDDHAIERLSKVEGLSNVGVSLVKYNRQSKVLVVVYDNSIIDLVSEKGIQTLPNLRNSNIILGEKKVNDIFMANDSIAYLAANFGISTLNLRTGLFPNTVKTGVEVTAVRFFNNRLYAATLEGLYTADPGSGLNLDDFSNWTWLGQTAGFPADYRSNTLAVFKGKLYLDVNDSLYVFDGTTAQYLHHQANRTLHFLTAEGAHLLVGYRCKGDCDGTTLIFDENHTFRTSASLCVHRPLYAIEDEQGTIWYADEFSGGYRTAPTGAGECQFIQVNSPYSINIREIAVNDQGHVWIASGGLSSTFSYLFRRDGFFSLIDGRWDFYNFRNQALMDPLADFYSIKVHPKNGKIFSGSFLDGLIEYDPANGDIKLYDERNSTLEFTIGDVMRTRVSGLAFDKNGNLWVGNHNSPRPLQVLKNDGTWQSFQLPCTTQNGVMDIAVDAFGYKWMLNSVSSVGITVFYEGDLADPTDDRCKVLNTSNTVLPTNEVTSVEVDREGSVWVGTKSGVVVFQCDVLNSDCQGILPFVEVEGFGAYLLEDQSVNTIGVDGANRKWFGTATGIFVQSPDGGREIAKFNVDNSPLFDNNIVDIAFDHKTGEVYIGTQKGLISLRAEATGGGVVNKNVLVFPNPVRPGYEGPIAISGLAQDANVKITDVNGQLVFETKALGGQVIWDGRDYNGRKANTGVYLVFATSNNSSDPHAAVTKILFIN